MRYRKVMAVAASAIAVGFVCVAAAEEESDPIQPATYGATAAAASPEVSEATPKDSKDVPLAVKPQASESASAAASNPIAPRYVVVTVATYQKCFAYRSSDGGRTWLPPVVLPGAANKGCYDADVAYAPDGGAVYAAYSIYVDDENRGVVVTRSNDDGATWADPPVVALAESGRYFFAPRLAVSLARADAQWVYLLAKRELDFGPIASIAVSRSDDRGVTWAPPSVVAAWDEVSDGSATLAGGIGGDVLLAWSVGEGTQKPGQINVMLSRDHAGHFGPAAVATDEISGISGSFDVKIGAKGTAHIVFDRRPQKPTDGTDIGYAWGARPYTAWRPLSP
ncbi:MAG: sialidase family protein [Rhodospirillales bacterium]